MIIEDSFNGSGRFCVGSDYRDGSVWFLNREIVETFSIENSLLDVVDLIESNNHGDTHL
jgi:hypothetical protein